MKRILVLGVIVLLLATNFGCIYFETKEDIKQRIKDHPQIPWWHVVKVDVDSDIAQNAIQEKILCGTEELKCFVAVSDPRLYEPRGYFYSMFDVVHDYLFDHIINTPTSVEMGETVYLIWVDKNYNIQQYERQLSEWREKYR